MSRKEIPWLRLLAEGVVIVGSILFAFGVDAWWDGAEERAEVAEALEALHDEVVDNRASLAANIRVNAIRLRGIARVLTLSQDEIAALPAPAADSILPQLLTYSTYTPRAGALEAMLSANVLEHVSDPVLRRSIAAWSGLMRIPEGQLHLLREAISLTAERQIALGLLEDEVVCFETRDRCDAKATLAAMLSDTRTRQILGLRFRALSIYDGQLRYLEGPSEELLAKLREAGAGAQ